MEVTENPSKSHFTLVIIVVLFFNFVTTVCVCYDAKDKGSVKISDSFLDDKTISWSAGSFPIIPWDILHKSESFLRNHESGLNGISECNFNIAGFVKPEYLPLCEKLGMGAIVIIEKRDYWRKLTDREIDLAVKRTAEKIVDSKAVIGYYIADEPRASHFPYLAKAVAAVRKYAPGKIAYINLFPNYATSGTHEKSQLEVSSYTEYLEKFIKEVKPQILSYDNYMVQLSSDLKQIKRTAYYYTNLIEVRRIALKYDLPFWNVVSSNQIHPSTPIPSPANLRFQAYTTLAAGGRGITWYKYYTYDYAYAPVDKSNRKTLTWRYLQEVNRQIAVLGPTMNQLNSTGVYFTSPAPAGKLDVLPGKLIRKVQSDTPVMVGEFKHNDGTNYVMVVNLSLEKSAKFTLETTLPYKKIQIVSAEDGTLYQMDNKLGLWLVAGQGVLIKLS
jgi:hypothetical protein